MIFVLGIIVGLLIAILAVSTLTFFRRVIEHNIEIAEKQVELVGPRPQGFIVEPLDESEEIRSSIIAKNKKRGADTPIEDLM